MKLCVFSVVLCVTNLLLFGLVLIQQNLELGDAGLGAGEGAVQHDDLGLEVIFSVDLGDFHAFGDGDRDQLMAGGAGDDEPCAAAVNGQAFLAVRAFEDDVRVWHLFEV